jgi:hypothetical protein
MKHVALVVARETNLTPDPETGAPENGRRAMYRYLRTVPPIRNAVTRREGS